MILKNKIKYCRQELELTQKELGLIFGVDRKTVSGWETGYDCIPLKKLIKFCNMYNYSIDYILSLTTNNTQYNNIIIDLKKIGNNLKSIRKKHNLTQEKVANKIRISQSCYSQYENGKSLLTTISLYSFAKNFNVSADQILNREKC